MNKKPYIDDYETVETLNEKGQVIKSIKYVGSYWNIDNDRKAVSYKKVLPVFLILLWVLYVLPFTFFANAFYMMWILCPYALILIPLSVITRAYFKTRKKEEPFIREVANSYSINLPFAVGRVVIVSFYVNILFYFRL